MRLDSLGTRLAALLTLAILPLGLIAVVQTYRVLDEASQKIDAALLGETLRVARPERGAIEEAIGAAKALAVTVRFLVDDGPACRETMSAFAAGQPLVHFAGYVPKVGPVTCASDETASVAGPGPAADAGNRRVIVRVIDFDDVTGLPSTLIDAPVERDGEVSGHVTLSLSLDPLLLRETAAEHGLIAPRDVLTFNSEGEVLTSIQSLADVDERLPANTELRNFVGAGPTAFRDVNASGQPRIYTLAPLINDTLYALAIWPRDVGVGNGGLWRWTLPTVVLPLLMWATSLGVAIFAVHRLVVRHIRRLRKRMRLFSRFRRIEEDPEDATLPIELAEVADSFVTMAHTIIRDEAEQEDSLREKDALLREIYHRVRNNLQLIASINNMQIRASRSPEAKHVLRRLQDRIMALATIHGSLYDAGALSKVRADSLVDDLARQITAKAQNVDPEIEVRTGTVPVMLHPDQAVPLALLVVEALTNGVKHLGRPEDGSPPFVSVVLSGQSDGAITLSVENSLGRSEVVEFSERAHDGLGLQLMDAFVTQLGGKKQIRQTDKAYRLTVRFHAMHYGEEAAIA